jgi:UDP-2-acetamido-2,6-beta-L-arabino-hexul-4-ose reductase
MISCDKKKKVLILGARGFIGSNLFKYLSNNYLIETSGVSSSDREIEELILNSDIVIHSIGVTRSLIEDEFFEINIDFSYKIYLFLLKNSGKTVIYFSSIHYHRNDLYGLSKRYNEYLFSKDDLRDKHRVFIIRTPGIFGPGAKPNKVSVVSTFCYNLVNNIKSVIHEPEKKLELLFIDDLTFLIEDLIGSDKDEGIITPKADVISVIDLYSVLENISRKAYSDLDLLHSPSLLKNLAITYNSFKND